MARITLSRAIAAAGLSFAAATTAGTLIPANAATPPPALHGAAWLTPQPCHIAGHTLPSGDAIKIDAHGDAWTAGTRVDAVREQVCTDGIWVDVRGYGQPEPTPWQRVVAYCHRARICVRPSRALRRALGIPAAAKAWERPENDAAGRLSTFVWVKRAHGVKTFVS